MCLRSPRVELGAHTAPLIGEDLAHTLRVEGDSLHRVPRRTRAPESAPIPRRRRRWASCHKAYPWPGNVREVQNVIERACALAEDKTITRRDLPDNVLVSVAAAPGPLPSRPDLGGPDAGADLPLKDAKARWMEVLEGAYLRDLLARHDGNISAAAKAAGIDRKTFHRLVNKYQLRS